MTGVLTLAGLELIFFIVAMFWIPAESSVDNTGMLKLFLSSVYTEPKLFLLLTEEAMGVQEAGQGHSWDKWICDTTCAQQ